MDGEMVLQTTLVGTLSVAESLVGNLSPTSSLKGTITLPSIIGGEPYQGEYIVTPLAFDPVVLPTRNKTLSDDVTVTKVPYYETSNIYDGKTVYIAEDINDG